MKILKYLLLLTSLVFIIGCGKKTNLLNDNQKYVKLLWRNKQFDWMPSSLISKNENLYFSDLKNNFYVIKLDNGKVNLKFNTYYNPNYLPLLSHENILLTEYSSDLSCFDTIGKLKWKIKGESNLRKDLAENNNFLFGSVIENGFSKINLSDGKSIWHLPKNSNITLTNKPAFFNDFIYLGLSEHYANLLAINNENGEIIWEREFENFDNLIQIKTKKGLLVCLTKNFENGKLIMLDFENGKEIWSVKLNCDIYYEPCLLNENIILSTNDNKVICLNISNGEVNWSLDLKNDLVESKIINYSGNLYFGTMNRNLYSIKNQTGKINFKQEFNYGICTPIIENNKIYFPTGGSEIWILK